MPVRSIKLKIKTRTGPEADKLRRALGRTHQLLNDGVAYYMEWLVLLRQEAYFENDKFTTKDEVVSELLTRICQQQKVNGWTGPCNEKELLSLLRCLYELLVPSAIGKKGSNQMIARRFLGPLVDPKSRGEQGEEILQKLEAYRLRPLFPLFTNKVESVRWLPKQQKRHFVRGWDRDMFQQALERVSSWESWNRRIAEERAKIKEQLNILTEQVFCEDEWVKKLRIFEKERGEEQDFGAIQGYLITPRQIRGWERVFEKWQKLGPKAPQEEYWQVVARVQAQLKGKFGDPVVYKFLSQPENHFIWRDQYQRLLHFAAVNKLTKRLNNGKQQANFTLADASKHPLWVRYEGRGGTNQHKYELIINDKCEISAKLEKLLWPEQNGWVEKRDVLIRLAPSKQFKKQVKLHADQKGKQKVTFSDYRLGTTFDGVLGGAKLQFDRVALEKSSGQEIVTANAYLNISIDVTPKEESTLNQAFSVFTPKNSTAQKISCKYEKLQEYLVENSESAQNGVAGLYQGLRVMSVDLGQRSSAAASVFEVRRDLPEPDNKGHIPLYYPIKDTGLFAVHQRSILLNLPGEGVSNKVWRVRNNRLKSYRRIRGTIRLLADILRLHNKKSPAERQKALEEMAQRISGADYYTSDGKSQFLKRIDILKQRCPDSEEQWQKAVIDVHRSLEPLIGEDISLWRKSVEEHSKKSKFINVYNDESQLSPVEAGLSIWQIEQLENTRRLLVSWSKRTRLPNVARSIERDSHFAPRLLRHTQNLKDDRAKKIADLLVKTALGYKYNDKRKKWEACYPPCQVILFEDLASYRFSMERSSWENSRLRKWAHRTIPKLVTMRGELYGLMVGEIRADFSSRFHAKTGAPGIRCHALTQKDLEIKMDEKELSRKYSSCIYDLLKAEMINEDQVSKLKPGHIVPQEGGELFVTLAEPFNKNGIRTKLNIIHADINAAQNLQRRFWQADKKPIKVPSCILIQTAEGEAYKPKYESYLGKGVFIKQDNDEYIWKPMEKIKMNKKEVEDNKEELEELIELEAALEEVEELKGNKLTFFRDPSGFFFSQQVWLPQKSYWGKVKKLITACLLNNIAN